MPVGPGRLARLGHTGDITYYAPWGNLAIFYRDSGYAKGLVKLGRIEGSVQMLEARGPLKACVEVAGKQ